MEQRYRLVVVWTVCLCWADLCLCVGLCGHACGHIEQRGEEQQQALGAHAAGVQRRQDRLQIRQLLQPIAQACEHSGRYKDGVRIGERWCSCKLHKRKYLQGTAACQTRAPPPCRAASGCRPHEAVADAPVDGRNTVTKQSGHFRFPPCPSAFLTVTQSCSMLSFGSPIRAAVAVRRR